VLSHVFGGECCSGERKLSSWVRRCLETQRRLVLALSLALSLVARRCRLPLSLASSVCLPGREDSSVPLFCACPNPRLDPYYTARPPRATSLVGRVWTILHTIGREAACTNRDLIFFALTALLQQLPRSAASARCTATKGTYNAAPDIRRSNAQSLGPT
jgi:hypothetical protein